MLFAMRNFFLYSCVVVGVVHSFTNTYNTNRSFQRSSIYTTAPNGFAFGKTSFGQVNQLVLSAEESSEAEEVQTDEAEEVQPEEAEEVQPEVKTSDGSDAKSNDKLSPDDEAANLAKTAYVVNLSYDTNGYVIRELFGEHGEVEKVFIPKNRATGKPKGMAFVTMGSEEQRDLAIEKLNDTELDGRTIYVDKSKPRTGKAEDVKGDSNSKKLYVGNISYDTTKDDLMDFFKDFGTVTDVYVPVDRNTNRPRGFAFVTMDSAGADLAIENGTGVSLQGRVIEVNESLPRGQKAPPRTGSINETKVYIGNLSFDTEEETLRTLYSEYGALIDLYIPTDRESGRPRGFAFVTMGKADALKAIEGTDGIEVDGRLLRVNEAQPKGYAPPRNDEWSEEEGEW